MSAIKTVNCSFCNQEIKRKSSSKSKNSFCNNTCKGKWQVLQRENLGFTKEWLVSEYIDKGKSCNQIAREIGRDAKRVWEWLRDYGIEKRPRGTDYGQGFQKGQESAFKGHKHTEENREKFRQLRYKDGHVPYLKDGIHWLHATGRHPASWRGGISPERQSFYATIEWSNAVKQVWKRDNAICQRCGKRHNSKENRGSFHIHHIVSFMAKELRSDVDNLLLVCRDCHLWIHSRHNTDKEFIKECELKQ